MSLPEQNRRDFLITLGSVVTAGIAGFFLGGTRAQAAPAQGLDVASDLPCLRAGLSVYPDGDGVILREYSSGELRCGVNHVGREIVSRLDGKHSVEAISADLAKYLGLPPDGMLEGKVAYFVTQLGDMGLLKSPYFVTLAETRG
jgi:Coenzyme PQQ synthesis protein D (PqqD)